MNEPSTEQDQIAALRLELEQSKTELAIMQKALAEKESVIVELNKKSHQARLAAVEAEKAKGPEVNADDLAVLSSIAKSPWGMQHHEIEQATGFSHEKVRLHVTRIMAIGLIAAHGGDKEPIRYRLDNAGRVHLDSKGML